MTNWTNDDKIIENKLGVLRLADMLGNVSQACNVNPGLGSGPYEMAWRTPQEYEATNQLRKGKVKGTTKGDIHSQIRFVSTAFGLAS